jgi:hypothetical protein
MKTVELPRVRADRDRGQHCCDHDRQAPAATGSGVEPMGVSNSVYELIMVATSNLIDTAASALFSRDQDQVLAERNFELLIKGH